MNFLALIALFITGAVALTDGYGLPARTAEERERWFREYFNRNFQALKWIERTDPFSQRMGRSARYTTAVLSALLAVERREGWFGPEIAGLQQARDRADAEAGGFLARELRGLAEQASEQDHEGGK
jgi:hypothetical protein